VTRAAASSVLLAERAGVFRLAASSGLSENYNLFLQGRFVRHGLSASRAAAQSLRPILIEDVASDPLSNRPEAREWKEFALRERYRAIMAVPLVASGRASGVLNLYRREAGPWTTIEIELGTTFGQHAASAINTASFVDAHRRQVDALERLVGVLRDQTHEYANRLQAVAGLLALKQTRAAEGFLAQLMTLHHDNYATIVERVHHPILAGLLVAQMSVARQRGVEVRLHKQTHLEALPASLGSAEAVTIVANLIENAVESVSQLSTERRRATVRMSESRHGVTIRVRDWGEGVEPGAERRMFKRGQTSKDGHAGIGLALVSEAVVSAGGTIDVRPARPGTTLSVTLPWEP
jgi:signal transduction histidine kinase